MNWVFIYKEMHIAEYIFKGHSFEDNKLRDNGAYAVAKMIMDDVSKRKDISK